MRILTVAFGVIDLIGIGTSVDAQHIKGPRWNPERPVVASHFVGKGAWPHRPADAARPRRRSYRRIEHVRRWDLSDMPTDTENVRFLGGGPE
jgi:hypothetical protein